MQQNFRALRITSAVLAFAAGCNDSPTRRPAFAAAPPAAPPPTEHHATRCLWCGQRCPALRPSLSSGQRDLASDSDGSGAGRLPAGAARTTADGWSHAVSSRLSPLAAERSLTNEPLASRFRRFRGAVRERLRHGRASWSPDGTELAFIGSTYEDVNHKPVRVRLYAIRTDEMATIRVITENVGQYCSPSSDVSWSPAGNKIAVTSIGPYECGSIATINPDGTELLAITRLISATMRRFTTITRLVA